LTHGLKAAGFNHNTYEVKAWFQSLLSNSTCTPYIMVHAPVALSRALMPQGFFPLRFIFPDVVVGVEQLMLHFFVPFILERANPKEMAKWLLHGWLRWASTKLRLSNYLIPEGGGDEQHREGDVAMNGPPHPEQGGTTAAATLTLHISELHGSPVDELVKVGISADLDLPWTDTVSSLTSWASQLVCVPPTKMIVNRGGTVLRDNEPMYACIPGHPRSSLHVLEIKFQSFGTRPGGLILVYNRAGDDEPARGGCTEYATNMLDAPLCVRVAMLAVSSWGGYCMMTTACVVGPIAVGRGLFDSFGLALNDVYTLAIGACAVAAASISAGFIVKRIIHSARPAEPARILVDVSVSAVRSFALSIAWLVVVPLLLGGVVQVERS
jgi:hypothetical protein